MSKLILNRRRLLGLGAASASSLVLAGCDQFDFLGVRGDARRDFLKGANNLTYSAQRALIGADTLAPEYAESEVRQPQRPNGSTNPKTAEYLELAQGNFAAYQLKVTGLVETPQTYSLDQIRNMPARNQITRHDCVEGWSCIAKWTGVPVKTILDASKPKPNARFAVFHCFDEVGGGLSGPERFYGSIDLLDCYHPQTILAYGLNNAALPVANGAPLRLRVERQLGYKSSKYVHTIELVDSLATFGQGNGGYWEDHGYEWYAGI